MALRPYFEDPTAAETDKKPPQPKTVTAQQPPQDVFEKMAADTKRRKLRL